MKRKIINYQEGTVFLVPLRNNHGYVRGIVARLDGLGRVFGYFFDPLLTDRKFGSIDGDLYPDRALFSGCFGDLGILEKHWPVVGNINLKRSEWPLPPFVRIVSGRYYIKRYTDDFKVISDDVSSKDEIPDGACEDGLMGYGFVEIRLTRLFGFNEKL